MNPTAVQWLSEKMIAKKYTIPEWNDMVKQALAIEKQQIIDAFDEGQEYEYQYHINNAPKFDSHTYYAETYGSNHIVDTNEMIDHIGDANKMVEISDDEIEEASRQINYGGGSMGWIKDAFKQGAKWYREQLKK